MIESIGLNGEYLVTLCTCQYAQPIHIPWRTLGSIATVCAKQQQLVDKWAAKEFGKSDAKINMRKNA